MINLQRRNLHLLRKSFDENSKLPDSLVTETAKHQSKCNMVWKKAKAAHDFKMFRDDLAKMIDLREQAADILMKVKGTKTPYDALLDQYEPKMTAVRIDEVFAELRDGLIKLINKVESSDVKPDLSPMSRKVPIEMQKKISTDVMSFIGYDTVSDKAAGRLDETEHPFTVGKYDDVRITTHYYEDRFFSNVFSVMHEGGHALYDQGIPREWMYQPIGTPCSYGIHESQSRFVENIVGRSPEFLSYALPRFRKFSPKSFKGLKNKDIIAAANAVVPSKVRIEADEVTYALHVIIRFEIEKDIFAQQGHRGRAARRCGTRSTPITSGSRWSTTARACCRTRTGPAAPSATSPPTPWATSIPACSWRRCRRTCRSGARGCVTATSLRCCNGFAPTCTPRETCTTRPTW